MDSTLMATAILTLMAGIGVFLVACTIMSTSLESLSSGKLKKLFSRTSDNKLAGVGMGAATTAAIQRSGATTVMIIGFVNAGMVSLTLAAAMIYGANIGTTITAQIVALGMFGDSVSMAVIFAALAGIGASISIFAKDDKMKKVGGILAGFGMLFVGLNLMSESMVDFAEDQAVKDFLAGIENIFLLVLIGAALTALVQSSSVITSVAITMVVTGLIDLEQGIYITLGSNIGSCIVAILAGFTSGKNAKRTALIHLLFNVSGVAIFVVVGLILGMWDISYGDMFEAMFPSAPQTQLAMFHTIFNVITVIIMLPLT
ncbi:MAG: Na/Pi cotransporter family protein, partial [Candidatus Methanomethylophilaceae archaeon]|nr:Na/Pi cotransporter family protein [Candidatus Methanomethylophilaceae archaeon]